MQNVCSSIHHPPSPGSQSNAEAAHIEEKVPHVCVWKLNKSGQEEEGVLNDWQGNNTPSAAQRLKTEC